MLLQTKYLSLCSFLVCISLFYTQASLISLPQIAESLSSSQAFIQLAFTANILGFGFSQIVYGPYSDIHGRKKSLLIGLILSLVGSCLCTISTKAWLFFVGQVIVGIGAGSCSIIPRAISKDVFDDFLLLKAISYMSIASTVATSLTPILCGFLQSLLGWRSIFIFLMIITTISIGVISYFLDETIQSRVTFISIAEIIKKYLKTLSDPFFLMYAVLNSLAYSAIIIYLIMSPFLFQKLFLFSSVQNSFIYFLCAMCYLSGNLMITKLNKKISAYRIIGIGVGMMLLGVGFIGMPFLNQNLSSIPILLCGLLIHFGSGLLTPITYKKILESPQFSSGITTGAINSMRVLVAFTLSSLILTLIPSDMKGLVYMLEILSLSTLVMFILLIQKRKSIWGAKI